MKKRHSSVVQCILACTLLMIAFSCKKELSVKSAPKNSSVTSAIIDSNFVTLAEATSIAQQTPTSDLVGNAMITKHLDGTVTGATRQIHDYTQYPNAISPSLYIFNYTGGGFVVVPSDKRIRPIIAFSSTGHFNISSNMPYGLTSWLDLNQKNMQVLRRNLTLARTKNMTTLWSQFTGINLSGSNKVIDKAAPPPPTCQPGTTNYQVGPLLTTTWAQGVPYNQYPSMPAGTYYYGGGKAPTGCVATAIAQVMYYWKYPATYIWTIMPTNSDTYTTSGETQVSRLMYNIGLDVYMTWGPTESSALASNTPRGFTKLGYSSATYADWNSTSSYMTVQSNIDSSEPVILDGQASDGGHEWVCDGYLESTITYCPAEDGISAETYLFFDMNWGWNEQGVAATDNVDGFYGYDEWDVYNGPDYEQFNSQMGMTYNIHP